MGQGPVYGSLRDPEKAPAAGPLTLADTTDPRDVLGKWDSAAHEGSGSKEATEAHETTFVSHRGDRRQATGSTRTGKIEGEEAEPASLTDAPGFAADTPHAKQAIVWRAETAAVVLDGPMRDTYLGWARKLAGQPKHLLEDPSARLFAQAILRRLEEEPPSSWGGRKVADAIGPLRAWLG